jgi:hypothetical protein
LERSKQWICVDLIANIIKRTGAIIIAQVVTKRSCIRIEIGSIAGFKYAATDLAQG